jgi:uncharacterized protein YjbI with pentapeptide repeats
MKVVGMNEDAGRDRLVRNVLIGAVVVVVVFLVALLVALGFGLQWYLSPKTDLTIVQRRNLVQGIASAGQALAVFLTGTVGLIGLFFTWQNTSQARKSTQQTLELTRRGQITERFTQAIDQLGATEGGKKNLEIRLGGIYALERTAREDKAYHWSIMEVLTTYVRTHAPLNHEKDDEHAYPDPDIQAILTVIGRRSVHHRDVEYGPIDLHATDLESANLRSADLRGAKLREANLSEAILEETTLREANLQDTNLRRANLQGAKLQEAFFEGAILRGAKLQGANLGEAILGGAILGGAFLQRAILGGAKLQGANLGEANLRGADLQGADLRDAILRGADLRDAILEGANVTDAQLADTRSLQGATKPDGSKHP